MSSQTFLLNGFYRKVELVDVETSFAIGQPVYKSSYISVHNKMIKYTWGLGRK